MKKRLNTILLTLMTALSVVSPMPLSAEDNVQITVEPSAPVETESVDPSASPTVDTITSESPIPSESPVPSETPVTSSAPVPTDTPVPTEVPVESETPVETEVPTESETPIESEVPVESTDPVASNEPIESEEPVASETPVETEETDESDEADEINEAEDDRQGNMFPETDEDGNVNIDISNVTLEAVDGQTVHDRIQNGESLAILIGNPNDETYQKVRDAYKKVKADADEETAQAIVELSDISDIDWIDIARDENRSRIKAAIDDIVNDTTGHAVIAFTYNQSIPFVVDVATSEYYTVDEAAFMNFYINYEPAPESVISDTVNEVIEPTLMAMSLMSTSAEMNSQKETDSSSMTKVREPALEAGYNFPQLNAKDGIQTFIAPEDGIYKITLYGADGDSDLGDPTTGVNASQYPYTMGSGGYGAQVNGEVLLNKGNRLYFAVGFANRYNPTISYNGGGAGYPESHGYRAGGGGAVSVYTAKEGDGQLYNYENHQDEILMVAGGGGGAEDFYTSTRLDYPCNNSACSTSFGGAGSETGEDGSGSGNNGKGGSYLFGRGESYNHWDNSSSGGGGNGLYGGTAGTGDSGWLRGGTGGGGSSYIDESVVMNGEIINRGNPEVDFDNGIEPNDGLALIQFVSTKPYTLTIHYVDVNTGEQVWEDYVEEIPFAEEYNVKSPDVPGFTPVDPEDDYIEGVMPEENVEVTVYYDYPALRINFIDYDDQDGEPLAPQYEERIRMTTPYVYTIENGNDPATDGLYQFDGYVFYTDDQQPIEGLKGDKDEEFTVYYVKEFSPTKHIVAVNGIEVSQEQSDKGVELKNGDIVTYEIRWENRRGQEVTESFEDILPDSLTFLKADDTSDGTVDFNEVSNTVTVNVTVPARSEGSMRFDAQVNSDNEDLPSIDNWTRQDPFISYTPSKSADPASGTDVSYDSMITYYINVKNNGVNPIHNLVVVDPIPEGVAFDWVSHNYDGFYEADMNLIHFEVPELLPDESVRLEWHARVTAQPVSDDEPITVTNIAYVNNYIDEADYGVNWQDVIDNGTPTNETIHNVYPTQITAVKDADPQSGTAVTDGDEIEYSVTLTNDGTVDSNVIRVDDTIPEGTSYVPNSLYMYSDNEEANAKYNTSYGDNYDISYDFDNNQYYLTNVNLGLSDLRGDYNVTMYNISYAKETWAYKSGSWGGTEFASIQSSNGNFKGNTLNKGLGGFPGGTLRNVTGTYITYEVQYQNPDQNVYFRWNNGWQNYQGQFNFDGKRRNFPKNTTAITSSSYQIIRSYGAPNGAYETDVDWHVSNYEQLSRTTGTTGWQCNTTIPSGTTETSRQTRNEKVTASYYNKVTISFPSGLTVDTSGVDTSKWSVATTSTSVTFTAKSNIRSAADVTNLVKAIKLNGEYGKAGSISVKVDQTADTSPNKCVTGSPKSTSFSTTLKSLDDNNGCKFVSSPNSAGGAVMEYYTEGEYFDIKYDDSSDFGTFRIVNAKINNPNFGTTIYSVNFQFTSELNFWSEASTFGGEVTESYASGNNITVAFAEGLSQEEFNKYMNTVQFSFMQLDMEPSALSDNQLIVSIGNTVIRAPEQIAPIYIDFPTETIERPAENTGTIIVCDEFYHTGSNFTVHYEPDNGQYFYLTDIKDIKDKNGNDPTVLKVQFPSGMTLNYSSLPDGWTETKTDSTTSYFATSGTTDQATIKSLLEGLRFYGTYGTSGSITVTAMAYEDTFTEATMDAVNYRPGEGGGSWSWSAPYDGTYKLEVWAPQGGDDQNGHWGGFGGYASGEILLEAGTTIYTVIGQTNCPNMGGNAANRRTFNGGGGNSGQSLAPGAGASHMATASGVLSSLASNKDAVLVVAGGGGAATDRAHGGAGGANGSGNNGQFGQGSDGTYGGGGGYYGGTPGVGGSNYVKSTMSNPVSQAGVNGDTNPNGYGSYTPGRASITLVSADPVISTEATGTPYSDNLVTPDNNEGCHEVEVQTTPYVECITDDLAVGMSTTMKFKVKVNDESLRPEGQTKIDNNAHYESLFEYEYAVGENPIIPSDTTNTVTHPLKNYAPDVTGEKSSDPVTGSIVNVGDNITYTIPVTNTGNDVAKYIVVREYIPGYTTYKGGSIDHDGAYVNDGENPYVEWVLYDVDPQETVEVSYTVTVDLDAPADAEIRRNAQYELYFVDPGMPGNIKKAPAELTNETVHYLAANPELPEPETPKVSVSKSSDPANGESLLRGEEITYTLHVSNDSENATARYILIEDPIPEGTTFVSAEEPVISGGGDLTSWNQTDNTGTTGRYTWNINMLPAGGMVDLTFTVSVDKETDLNEITNVGLYQVSDDPLTELTTPEETNEIVHHLPDADVSASKSADPESGRVVSHGSLIDYTITVINNGEGIANYVNIEDVIPEGTTYYDFTAMSSGDNDLVIYDEASNSIRAVLYDLMPNETRTVTFTVTVNDDVQDGQYIFNTGYYKESLHPMGNPNQNPGDDPDHPENDWQNPNNPTNTTEHIVEINIGVIPTGGAGWNSVLMIGGGVALVSVGIILIVMNRKKKKQ